MERRSFLNTIAAASIAPASVSAAEGAKKTRFYALEQYFLKHGTQLGRLHDFASKALLPVLDKVHSGPKIFLEAIIAPHMPQVAMIFGFSSWEEWWSVRARVNEDASFLKSFEQAEEGAEPLVEKHSTTLLEATAYSPEITAKPADKPRIFELRAYHSPTWRQLKALHERFAGPEVKIFHRVGVHPLLYTSTVIGDNMPNLTYLTPFDSLAAREKAWDAFAADPEWVKARKESIDKHGQIANVIQIALYRATAYSPIR